MIVGYWQHRDAAVVFAGNMVEVENEMKAQGIEKADRGLAGGDSEVEGGPRLSLSVTACGFAYSDRKYRVAVLGAKYKWARGAGLL